MDKTVSRQAVKDVIAEFLHTNNFRNAVEGLELLALETGEQIAADKLPKPIGWALGLIEKPINQGVVSATDKALGGQGQGAPAGAGSIDIADLVRQLVPALKAELQASDAPPASPAATTPPAS